MELVDQSESSTLVPPSVITDPSEIDLEAGSSEQIQCRICLETDGQFSFFLDFTLLSFIYCLKIKIQEVQVQLKFLCCF